MIHTMKLKPEPFDAIAAGTKTIEVRLLDEKRQLIQAGDEIHFLKLPELHETVSVRVVELMRYPNFLQLFESDRPEQFGGESVQGLHDQIRGFYSVEEESKFGVLGIRIKLLS